MQAYSTRHAPIPAERFQAARTSLGLGDFVRAEPVPFGVSGSR